MYSLGERTHDMQNKIAQMIRATLAMMVLTCLTALPAQAKNCRGWENKGTSYWKRMTLEKMQACIKSGANASALGDYGWAIIHLAARSNDNPEVIKALIEAGANPNARNSSIRLSPLHRAAKYNQNAEITEVLINMGADVNALTLGFGLTPLHFAAQSNKNPEVINLLAAAGADMNAVGYDFYAGVAPIHQASAYNSNPEVVSALLANGADGALKDDSGKSPFEIATGNPNLKGSDAYRQLEEAEH